MNYIYDILLNFNETLYDFYDWNMKDDIKHIRRIPIFKVSSEDFLCLKENEVVIDKVVLNKIYNKTEVFENRKIIRLDYTCLFSDGLETIGIRFDHDGKSIQKTRLLIDEDSEVIDLCVHLDEEEVDYNTICLKKPEYLKTRKEIQMHDYLINELDQLVLLKDIEKLKYLYYECFDKLENSVDHMIEDFRYEMEHSFQTIAPKLNDFFKLTSLNK